MTFKWTFLKFSSIWNLLEFLRFRKHKQRILQGRGGEKKKKFSLHKSSFLPEICFSELTVHRIFLCFNLCPGNYHGSALPTVAAYFALGFWPGTLKPPGEVQAWAKPRAMMPGLTFRQEDVFWPLYKHMKMNLIRLYKWMLCRKESQSSRLAGKKKKKVLPCCFRKQMKRY